MTVAVIQTLPAVCGVTVLVVVVLAGLVRSLTDPAREDRVTPYREGLDAANRMQRAAQDLERQIYAEAARQIENDQGDRP